MKLGVTATQRGLTPYQKSEVRKILLEKKPSELHHGDCIGGDADIHQIASEVGILKIHIHPSNSSRKRAFCRGGNVVCHLPKPPLDRNHDIVNQTDELIGCPRNNIKPKDFRGEGTWSTIHYAETKTKKPVTRVYPNSTITTTTV